MKNLLLISLFLFSFQLFSQDLEQQVIRKDTVVCIEDCCYQVTATVSPENVVFWIGIEDPALCICPTLYIYVRGKNSLDSPDVILRKILGILTLEEDKE